MKINNEHVFKTKTTLHKIRVKFVLNKILYKSQFHAKMISKKIPNCLKKSESTANSILQKNQLIHQISLSKKTHTLNPTKSPTLHSTTTNQTHDEFITPISSNTPTFSPNKHLSPDSYTLHQTVSPPEQKLSSRRGWHILYITVHSASGTGIVERQRARAGVVYNVKGERCWMY